MSVDLIPMLIDEKTLAGEITRLAKTLPAEKLDSWETQFHEALFYEHGSNRNQYAYAKLEDFYKNTKRSIDADSMRFQMLIKTRETVIDDGKTERNADALFQFFGAFFCCFARTNPFNEFGFQNSTIISPANSRRLHLLFQQIDFDLLRPIFDQHCKRRDNGHEYSYIGSFGELVDYAKALDGLLIQAVENGKWLYIYAG
jgi:hypothetical protein